MTASEHQIVGKILNDGTLIDELECFVDLQDFEEPQALETIKIMKSLSNQGKEINLVSVSTNYNNDPEIVRYLANCQRENSGTFQAHAQFVREKADERRIHKAISAAQEIMIDPHSPLQSKLELCQNLFLDAVDSKQDSLENTDTQLDKYTSELKDRAESGGFVGLTTPWPAIDEVLCGLRNGELITVAARPGMGKTNFALNLYSHSVKQGKKCLYFSLEMTSQELLDRLTADWANIYNSKLNDPASLTEMDWHNLKTRMMEQYKQLDTFIDASSTQTLGTIRAKARRVKKSHGLDLIIIDHIGLMDHGYQNETQGISEISKHAKRIAKDFDCPVVILSQLNRDCEKRPNKRPLLSDLRQSGSIEQDSNVVIFLYRDEYYDEDSKDKGLSEVIISKVRRAKRGTIPLKTEFEYCRFANTDRGLSEDEDDFSNGIGF